MKREHTLLHLTILFCLSGSLYAQPWSSVLSASRAIDWSRAGAGLLPQRSTICVSWFSGSGAPASGAGVNGDYYFRTDTSAMYKKASGAWALTGQTPQADAATAISGCADSQVVFFNSGTYTFTSQILISQHNNVTIRGAGPMQTTLAFTGLTLSNSPCIGLGGAICVTNGGREYGRAPTNTATWTAGYSQNTNTITIGAMTTGSISTLRVGSLLILDQCDTNLSSGDNCTVGNGSDNGNMWVCQTFGSNGSCSQQGDNASSGRTNRSQNQQVMVTSITGTGPWTVGITPGLYAPNWSAGQTPGVWWSNNLPITGVGFEDMTLDYRGITVTDFGAGIYFFNSLNCWVKNIRSLNAYVHKHIWFYQASKNTVRDSYFYGSSPSSEGYGTNIGSSSCDELIENNIFHHIAAATITEGACGTVFGYNYATDNYYTGNGTAPDWQGADSADHSAEDQFNLWEGHEGSTVNADDIHGTSHMLSFFRVFLRGLDPVTTTPKTQSTWSFFPWAGSRYHNVVGSVLGTQSYHTHYTTVPSSTTDCGNTAVSYLSVFVLGYANNAGIGLSRACGTGTFDIPNDLNVAKTLMRWGNYAACTGDAACNAVRFVNTEVPSGISPYGNPVPATQALPPSFYLNSKPSWWGTMPWPAVGPDVTGGNIANVGGHAYHNPAGNCYLNVLGGSTNGTTGALTFDAKNCYAAGSTNPPNPPNPPTSLSVVVQ